MSVIDDYFDEKGIEEATVSFYERVGHFLQPRGNGEDLKEVLEDFLKHVQYEVKKTDAYKAGYNCGLNGANTINCHFSIFSNPENTKEWERGKKEAEKFKKQQEK